MPKYSPLAIAMMLLLAVSLPGHAQEGNQGELLEKYMDTLRKDLTAQRDATMRAVIKLDEEQGKKFWPMKKQYDKELRQIGEARRNLIKEWGAEYSKLTAVRASEFATRSFEIQDQRTALRKKYFAMMANQISPVIAAQFLQLQGQYETMADLKLATYIPIAVEH
jgi:hypothetical protein